MWVVCLLLVQLLSLSAQAEYLGNLSAGELNPNSILNDVSAYGLLSPTSPTARKEVLLLALNHERAKTEEAVQAVAVPNQASRNRRSSLKSKAAISGLYVDQEGEDLTDGRSDV